MSESISKCEMWLMSPAQKSSSHIRRRSILGAWIIHASEFACRAKSAKSRRKHERRPVGIYTHSSCFFPSSWPDSLARRAAAAGSSPPGRSEAPLPLFSSSLPCSLVVEASGTFHRARERSESERSNAGRDFEQLPAGRRASDHFIRSPGRGLYGAISAHRCAWAELRPCVRGEKRLGSRSFSSRDLSPAERRRRVEYEDFSLWGLRLDLHSFRLTAHRMFNQVYVRSDLGEYWALLVVNE